MAKTIRQGLGAGKGAGYSNILPTDPRIHNQSRMGIKQPQAIPAAVRTFIERNPDKVREMLEKRNFKIQKTFTLDELDPKAREKALEKLRQYEWEDPFNAETISEDMTERLKEHGINIKDKSLQWDASYGQSDFVSYEATMLDLDKFFKGEKLSAEVKKGISLVKRAKAEPYIEEQSFGGGDYRNYFKVQEIATTEKDAEPIAALEKAGQERLKDINRQLLKDAYAHWDYVSSDEHAIEMIEANEYRFLATGDLA
jgi:hypothetical protein